MRWVGLLFAVPLVGCATLPGTPVRRALYSDVRQVVETRERIGWLADSYEIRNAAPTVLQSVCQVSEEDRVALLDWFDARIEAEGGPADVAFERTGDLDDVEELLTLERMRDTLEHTDAMADTECPFWLKPDSEFAGVQTDTDRFILLGESGGGLSMIVRGDKILIGGGGGLRLMPGYGFTDRFTMAAGVELGGTGGVSPGDEEPSLSARPHGGIPVLLRFNDDTWRYDLELTPLVQYIEGQVNHPGFRIAPAMGISSVRIAGIMPIIMGMVAYEFNPAFNELPASHTLRLGTRVGFDFDP